MLKDSIELHRQGRLDEAEPGYRAQLAAHPDDAETLHMLGRLLCQRSAFAEGRELLTRALALAPDHAGIQLALASLDFSQGAYDAARSGYRRALALDPNLGSAHAGLGQIALLHADPVAAEEHFRIALRTGEQPYALAGIGALLLSRGDHEGALRHLARAADLVPADPTIQMTLGRAFAKRGSPVFAEQALRNALRLKPDLHQARQWLAEVLVEAARIGEAEALYREMLEVPECAAIAQIGLGDAARADGRFDEAVARYRVALKRDPAQPMVERVLAWSLARLGRNDEAVAVYDAAIARAPDDADLRSGQVDLLLRIGRIHEAAAALKELLERNPADHAARSRLAIVSEHLGDASAAQAHAEIVLTSRNDTELELIRIRALLHAGDHDAARSALDALATRELTPSQAAQRLNHLGYVHDRAGEAAQAVRCFAEAQRGLAEARPVFAEPGPEFAQAIAEPPAEAWPDAPVLLLGTPGSGVERVAALLADQPGLVVLRDRVGAAVRDDDFSQPRFQHYCAELAETDRAALRERYLAMPRAAGLPDGRPIVDWLPCWDARLLALVRRAMPGTRLVIVERDPRDALLNWLGFGWLPGFPCSDVDTAASWLARAHGELAFGADLDEPRRIVVAADALLDDPGSAGDALARFLGIEFLEPGAQFAAAMRSLGDLPVRFPAGHWRAYADALAGAFARLPA